MWFLLTPVLSAYPQKLKKADKAILHHLQAHVQFLASDLQEGRRAGTTGEKLAHEYIVAQFQSIGLQPKGEANGWLQPFAINDGREVSRSSFFFINDHEIRLQEDFFPLSFSASKSVEALVTIALAERGVPWFWDLKELLEENRDNPHFDLQESIKTRVAKNAERGATAMIIYNSGTIADQLAFNPKDRSEPAAIPVIYLKPNASAKYLADRQASLDLKLKVEFGEKTRTGHNVIGYIDNGAAHTVIIGAHYDHLGYGEDGNSMLRTGEKLVHNGADDNASGTAGMIELARLLKKSKNKSANYLFLAFSAEELGLNGSKFFSDHPTIDLSQTSFMVNMDMIGRLNDSSRVLTVGGYGTSPWWGTLFRLVDTKQLQFKYDSSGTGPSDHTSFYRKDIPVLFFFTGLHTDYHRPTDDYDKINYRGALQVVKLVSGVIEASARQDKLVFTKTRETQTTTSARFSVSMGIMPDYTFTGNGVHVDGISEGRPAQKAGLQKGDIIIQLGAYPTSSVESYMQALGKFKKGDKTTIKYKRGGALSEAEVQF